MKRKIRRTLGLFLVLGLVGAVPALATDSVVYTGGYAQIKPGYNNLIHACDIRVDGHRVRAWYYHTLGDDAPTYTAWAPSGGCSDYQGTAWAQPITRFRVCVEDVGCSEWVTR
jgi:hypothetical protein